MRPGAGGLRAGRGVPPGARAASGGGHRGRFEVGLLSPDEGEKLIARTRKGGATLRAESHPSPFVGAGGRGEEWRYDYPAYSEWGIGTHAPVAIGTRRTDWVGTDGANRWGHEATDGRLNAWGVRRKYEPGTGYRLDAPRKAGFVPLRVTATDSAGTSVDQTVIRAVGLR